MICYDILEYLRSHPDDHNTVNQLMRKLGLKRSCITTNLQKLEYMKLVTREPKAIADCFGIKHKNFVYLPKSSNSNSS
jgi:DNA-binding IclR family transcriptional regulator